MKEYGISKEIDKEINEIIGRLEIWYMMEISLHGRMQRITFSVNNYGKCGFLSRKQKQTIALHYT